MNLNIATVVVIDRCPRNGVGGTIERHVVVFHNGITHNEEAARSSRQHTQTILTRGRHHNEVGGLGHIQGGAIEVDSDGWGQHAVRG